MIATDVEIKPNTIVQYQGGGYDGCMWEWNYAYFDNEGEFHSIVASGRKGCRNEEQLRDYIADADEGRSRFSVNEYDLYELDEEGEIERFGRETPISHLLTVGKWLREEGFDDVKLTVACDVCGTTVPVVNCEGEGSHGIGGIQLEHDEIVCSECVGNGSCIYCGEYVGSEYINGESGHCTGAAYGARWCHETQAEHQP